jgi:phage terminase large subunit-like protein
MTPDPRSLAEQLAELAAETPDGPTMVAEMLAGLSDLEAATLAFDWENIWRKPKQTPPTGPWQTWGALTGRGFGKSRANAEFVNGEAQAGRAMRIALICQNEDRCVEVMIEGESGLVTLSPPWFKARFEAGRVIWPNGAQAFIFTPHKPDDIFGPEHHLAWASELHAWPTSTMVKAWDFLMMGLRLGYGRLVWDSNPRRRHPIIRDLLADCEADPVHHFVVRGSSRENRLHLTPGKIEQWERKYAGTQAGREMLDGEQTDEDAEALWEQEWITAHRRAAPPKLVRRILVADPAISMREGTDATGISDGGLDADEQVYIFADLSKKIAWDDWGDLLVERYFINRCDCIVLERNRGGDACAGNVRTAAEKYGRAVGPRHPRRGGRRRCGHASLGPRSFRQGARRQRQQRDQSGACCGALQSWTGLTRDRRGPPESRGPAHDVDPRREGRVPERARRPRVLRRRTRGAQSGEAEKRGRPRRGEAAGDGVCAASGDGAEHCRDDAGAARRRGPDLGWRRDDRSAEPRDSDRCPLERARGVAASREPAPRRVHPPRPSRADRACVRRAGWPLAADSQAAAARDDDRPARAGLGRENPARRRPRDGRDRGALRRRAGDRRRP